jgi:hypothetical protein
MSEHETQDEQPGYFGGMTAEEAGRKSAEKRRLEKELAVSDPQELIVAKATEKALAGDVQAMKLLLDLKVLVPVTSESKGKKGLLALLTTEQRACVAAALRHETVDKALAYSAWCK